MTNQHRTLKRDLLRAIKLVSLCFCLMEAGTAQSQQPTVAQPDDRTSVSTADLDRALESASELAVTNKAEKPVPQTLPFTTDTQIRIMGLFEPTANKDLLPPVAHDDTPYLLVENVPLRSLLHLLVRRSGLNYLEPDDDQALDDSISLEMKETKPRELLDWLLKHRNLELFDASTGIFTIRKYTNQLSFYKFKLRDNFIDRFKGSAQGAGGGASGGSGGSVGSGGGNAVSANSGAIQVENGGKYGDIEALLEKVANAGDEKNSKAWYFEEKQYVLLYGTRNAADRITEYLDIANQRNPNIKIEVRIFGTGANPASRLGVDWSSMMSPGLTFGLVPNNTALGGGTNGVSGLKSLGQLASAFGSPLSTVVLRNDIAATLNFFVNESKAEALAQPSAITANGREVAFAATEQIPYISGSSVSGAYGGTSGVGYDNTAFVNVGTTINILPRIQDGKRLKLGTALSVSQLDEFVTVSSGTQGSPPRQVPKTSGRAFSGEFTINSGDTVVLAGLKTSTTSKNRNKIPFLGDIPGVGKLFRNESNSKNTTYLTVFITATLLDENNQPGIPAGRLTRQDSCPDPESTLSAEPNMRHLGSPSEWQDKAVVHAKREALEIKTQQVNQLVSARLEQEDKLREMAGEFERKEQEVKALEAQQKQLKRRTPLEGEGSIDAIKQDIETRLIKVGQEQGQMRKALQDGQAGLSEIQDKEEKAKNAMERAEQDYTTALRESFPAGERGATHRAEARGLGTNQPPVSSTMSGSASPKQNITPSVSVPSDAKRTTTIGPAQDVSQSDGKAGEGNPVPKKESTELDENAKLLKRL